jgi:signal transduction histidine kinase/ligand-binding sensor domain-containing protein/CheY-like chemotaxis protein/HPt (histidine-containing phosphotransfer) domain-containing protein
VTTTRQGGSRASLIIASLILTQSVAFAAADSPPLILEHLTTADGLPQGSVYVTLQDSQGFVWLGTEDGLVRYDGHELLRYAHSPSATGGLPGNFIFQIVEDARHDLWIVVKDAGIARWSRATDTFTVYRHNASDPQSLSSDAVRTLVLGPDGTVWVGTSNAGLDAMNPATGRFEHFRHDDAVRGSVASNNIFTLTLDRAGRLWVGTDNGLDRWQGQQRSFAHLPTESAQPFSGREVSRILEDRSGALWAATFDGGLNRLDRDGQLLQTFRHDPKVAASIADNDVRALLEDQAGRLWVGTVSGLDLLDRATGEFSHHQQDPADPESLRDSFIVSLAADSNGLLWIGSKAGGVSRWNPRSWELGEHRPDWLRDKPVTSFADGPGNRIWIGTQGGGLSLFDTDTGTTTSVDAVVGRANAIGDTRVMSLLQDHQGGLWIGTMKSGLKKLTAAGRLESIPVKVGEPRALSAAGIMTVFQARTGQLWIGTHGGGVNILDPMTALVRQLPFDSPQPGSVSAANVSALAEDREGNIWIGTDGGGLDLARADGTVVRVFRHEANNPASLPANTIYALATDAQNRVWVATDGGGLARVSGSPSDPASIRFQTVSREQGLSSDTIYGLLVDGAGHVWLSGTAGLMRYDPETGAVKTFHRENGLQGEEFNFNAYFRLRDGRLCFGGTGGFNLFDPSRLTEHSVAPRLALTGVQVMGVPAPGPVPYWLLKSLTLDYRANIVSLDFGSLDFTSPGRNRLAYRIHGLTDDWIDLGTQHRVNLTNLDAGDHILEVRAANSDSIWSATPFRLRIHRDPLPWKSPWAYTLYAAVVLGLILYRARQQRIQFQRVSLERQRLESEVALRTKELTVSNRQLEEAAKAKSDFLDRMSHELRTPMNGVVGMTELLARTPLSGTQAKLTQTIRSSAQVLLQIVNDLLDLSKINAGKVVLEELPIELSRILEECTSLFAGAIASKRIGLSVHAPEREPRNLVGDPLRVRQILMNLVGNAVKFTEHGEITVTADVVPVDAGHATVHLSVADTGIGMDAATVAKIFTPFTQADESTTRRFGGSGLGLAICRDLAELMGGTISVESQPKVGSTFRVVIPLKLGAEANLRQPTQRPAEIRLRGHVLVVEDEPVNAAVSQGYLASLGCTSVWVKDGHEAITRCASERFDLILMDLNMPTMTGFEATALIRQKSAEPRVPIIALTAHDEASYREKCLKGGMDDMLSKPCTLEECATVLSRWLDRAEVGESPAARDGLVDSVAVARLGSLRSGQSNLFPRLVDLFQASSAEAMEQLRSAFETRDLVMAGAQCHKLASSAANVGALSFAADVRHLEHLCAAGEATSAQPLFEKVWTVYPALIEELSSLRRKASA